MTAMQWATGNADTGSEKHGIPQKNACTSHEYAGGKLITKSKT